MTKNIGSYDFSGQIKADGTVLGGGESVRIDIGTGRPRKFKPDGLQRTQWMPYELWVFAGQSNIVGTPEDTVVDRYGEDAPHPKVLAVVQGDRNDVGGIYRLPAQGSLIVAQQPFEDGRGVCCKLAFAKARVERFPGIKEIAILSRGWGASGFSHATNANRWQPPGFDGNVSGDPQFNGSYTIAENFLAANPRYRLAGLVTDLLASEVDGTTQEYAVDAMEAYVAAWRRLRGGDQALYIQSPIPRSFVGTVPLRVTMRAAQAEAASTIPRGYLLRADDLTTYNESGVFVHFTKTELRKLGRMIDEAAAEIADFTVPQAFPRQRMQYSATEGRYVNIYGGGERIHAEVVETDADRGTVLRCDRSGFDTSLRLPPNEYTIAFWAKRMHNPFTVGETDAQDFFIMGKLDGQSIGNAFSRTVQGHHETSVQGLAQFPIGTPNDTSNPILQTTNWFHLALTYKDGTFACYRNGVSIAATGGNNGGGTYPPIDGPRCVQIGAWGDTMTGSFNSGVPDMRFDDIVILPTALNQAAITKLYSKGVID